MGCPIGADVGLTLSNRRKDSLPHRGAWATRLRQRGAWVHWLHWLHCSGSHRLHQRVHKLTVSGMCVVYSAAPGMCRSQVRGLKSPDGCRGSLRSTGRGLGATCVC
eukprot:scaffold119747_cov22-Tisochrysis_lutea.AAC.1